MTNAEVIQELLKRPPDENCVIDPDSGGKVTKVVEDGDDAAGGYTTLVGSYHGELKVAEGKRCWCETSARYI